MYHKRTLHNLKRLISGSERNKISRSTDFEALKLRNVRSGRCFLGGVKERLAMNDSLCEGRVRKLADIVADNV